MSNRSEPKDDRAGAAAEIEQIATEWFFRRDGGMSHEDETALARWLRESEQHARAFAAIEHTWARLGEARGNVVSFEAPRTRRHIRFGIATAVAAAAVIVIAAVGWRQMASTRAVFAEQAATEVGGLRRMDLPDGSFATLNTDTAVDVQFTRSTRQVRLLRGEAHFTVASDPRRAFVVEAKGVAVKAVGTAFNVRLRPDTVEVLVTHGKVRVDDAARGESLVAVPESAADRASAGATDQLLLAGQRVLIPVRDSAAPMLAVPASVSAPELERSIAWQNRRLEYVDVPLSEIVADFNRYNQHRLVIVDPRLAALRFGGSFAAGDYNSLVELLEGTFGVVVERRARETALRLP